MNQCGRLFPEKTGQDEEIDAAGFEFVYLGVAPEKLFLVNDQGGYSCCLRFIKYPGGWFITYHQGYLNLGMIAEVFDDFLGVGAGS